MTTETRKRFVMLLQGEPFAVEGFQNWGQVARWVAADGTEVLMPWHQIRMVGERDES